ncbi:unnamed protein product [Adineta ricciae]|uniref:enoyl-CoA hydratase n=1 Tax=Adineta ricciae TaxID=249248 RepID=A0A813QES5_ADIRI|nr:unnamed protein product [Adineta ricciae]
MSELLCICLIVSQYENDLADLKNLKIRRQGTIAVVEFNQENAKVNTLSQAMMNEFVPLFTHLKNDESVRGIVVISAKPGSFIAGADINMLESAKSRDELYEMSRHGQEVMDQIEQSSKPIVAAIGGSCLGGGFEVALACHYRIALNDKRTTFGLPEVKLGLLPGAGGTQRLLRELLLSDALDLLLTGREIKPKQAKALGLIDVLVEPVGTDEDNIEHLCAIAIEKVNQKISKELRHRQPSLMENIKSKIISNRHVRNYILSQAQAKVIAQTQGLYPAPLRILDVIKQTLEHGITVGFSAEAEAFADLGMTNESKALISLFHGRTECKKNKYGKAQREVKTFAIVGADTIGSGIANVSIDKDLQVILHDSLSDSLSHGRSQIQTNYQNSVKRNRITQADYSRILSNLKCQTTFDGFDHCDFIIEAVFEDARLKQKILDQLERLIPEHCIYASNTSTISIHEIAEQSRRPEKVIGMHYFSPVEKVELLEIVRTKQTSDDTICSAVNLGLKQGKLVIVVNDGPGFYTTRLMIFACVEILSLLKEGLTPKDIDQVTRKFGFHVGLASLLDEFGIDIIAGCIYRFRKIFGELLIDSSIIQLLQIFVKHKLFGRKSGQGLYIYSKDNKKENNPKIREILKIISTEKKERSTMEHIQWRIALRLLNEAARCLEENIITSPTDGDIGAVFGLGFPPMKGGPFHFMDTFGIFNIVDLMHNYQLKYGDRFAPTQLLINMSQENKTFYP